MEVTYTRLGARGERWSTPRGVLEIRMPASDVVVRRLEGYASAHFVEPAVKHLEILIEAGMQPTVFDDFELGVGYDSDVRVKLTAWHSRHVGELKETHVLVGTGLVAMGVSVANLATGGAFTSYTERAAFEWALADALASRFSVGPGAQPRAPSER